jgi:hypothetical protein
VKDIGAASPGRWQATHRLKMIGATSLAKVGFSGAALAAKAASEHANPAIGTLVQDSLGMFTGVTQTQGTEVGDNITDRGELKPASMTASSRSNFVHEEIASAGMVQ